MSRKKSMDYARYKIKKNAQKRRQEFVDKTTLRNAIEDLRYRAARELWEKAKRPIPSMESDDYHELPDVVIAQRR